MCKVDKHKQCLASLSRVLSDHVVLVIRSVLEKHNKTENVYIVNQQMHTTVISFTIITLFLKIFNSYIFRALQVHLQEVH